MPRIGKGCNPGTADTDQRKFGGNEESIRKNEKEDDEDLEGFEHTS